jgi:hypothetical protein
VTVPKGPRRESWVLNRAWSKGDSWGPSLSQLSQGPAQRIIDKPTRELSGIKLRSEQKCNAPTNIPRFLQSRHAYTPLKSSLNPASIPYRFRALFPGAPPPPSPRPHTMLGLTNMQPRQLATQMLNFALVLSTAFMMWKGLSVVSDSPSPIVVVLSGSMEPAFQRGDLLFLWNRGLDTKVGEIVVYNVKGKDIPIVHRVVRRYGGG